MTEMHVLQTKAGKLSRCFAAAFGGRMTELCDTASTNLTLQLTNELHFLSLLKLYLFFNYNFQTFSPFRINKVDTITFIFF